MYAPVVPAINDHELESVLDASAAAGATTAGYVLLRLPGEVKDLFFEWLELHFPDRAQKVRNRIRELRGGRDNDSRFGHRMRGQGPWAEFLRRRFEAGCRQNGLGSHRARTAHDRTFQAAKSHAGTDGTVVTAAYTRCSAGSAFPKRTRMMRLAFRSVCRAGTGAATLSGALGLHDGAARRRPPASRPRSPRMKR